MTRFVSALRRAPHLRITGERQRLLASFAAVFLFGLLAHGYAFTNFTVSHDSLNEMFLSGDIRYAAGSVADWKISLGRFLYPAYRTVFSGGAGTPWLSGVLSLVWVSLAVYLVSRLFSVDNALLLAVIGALFVTNVSYSALAATYIYDLDGDMLAMLLAVCAAYLLLRGTLRRRALAVIPIVGSLALYQAMISVTVSLVMIACILRLLENESAKAVFFDGLKAVGILFIGGAAYYILVRAVSSASGVALDGGYNSLLSLGRMTPDLLPEAVRSTYDTWARSTVRQPVFVPLPVTRAGHLLLAVLTLAAAACFLLRKRLPAANLLLALVLAALLPMGMNLSNFLGYAGMEAHDLMKYAFCLVYVFDILLLRQCLQSLPESRVFSGCAAISLALIAALVWGNIQTANALYLKKDLERQATLSRMTELCLRLDQTEGYVPGETPVVFIGLPSFDTPEALGSVSQITGAWGEKHGGRRVLRRVFFVHSADPDPHRQRIGAPRGSADGCNAAVSRGGQHLPGGRYAHRPDGIKKAQRPASTRRPLCFIIFTSMRCGIRDRGRRPPARPRSLRGGFPASASPWTRGRWR